MPVSINSNELLKILNTTPAEQNIMLTGRHGIGKSQIYGKRPEGGDSFPGTDERSRRPHRSSFWNGSMEI